jgi:hypothetical protein
MGDIVDSGIELSYRPVSLCSLAGRYDNPTLRKKNKNFLIYKEIQNGAVAKSYMRKGFLIYEEAVSYI